MVIYHAIFVPSQNDWVFRIVTRGIQDREPEERRFFDKRNWLGIALILICFIYVTISAKRQGLIGWGAPLAVVPVGIAMVALLAITSSISQRHFGKGLVGPASSLVLFMFLSASAGYMSSIGGDCRQLVMLDSGSRLAPERIISLERGVALIWHRRYLMVPTERVKAILGGVPGLACEFPKDI